MTDDEKAQFEQAQKDIAFLKEQLAIHAKNTEDALDRVAKANQASGAAVEGNSANTATLAEHDVRIAALEKKG